MKKACELFQDLGPSSNEHCPYLLQAQLLGPQMREPDSAVVFLFQSFFVSTFLTGGVNFVSDPTGVLLA